MVAVGGLQHMVELGMLKPWHPLDLALLNTYAARNGVPKSKTNYASGVRARSHLPPPGKET